MVADGARCTRLANGVDSLSTKCRKAKSQGETREFHEEERAHPDGTAFHPLKEKRLIKSDLLKDRGKLQRQYSAKDRSPTQQCAAKALELSGLFQSTSDTWR